MIRVVVKYVIVGTSNAAFTFLVYLLLLKAFNVHYLVSFTISWISGVLYSYIANYIWAFKQRNSLSFGGKFAKYMVIYVSSYLLNVFLLRFFVERISLGPFYAQLTILPIIVCLNFIGINYWALKR